MSHCYCNSPVFASERILGFLCDVKVLRDHWKSSPASSLQLQELGPLLRDYQRLILRHYTYGFTLQSSLYNLHLLFADLIIHSPHDISRSCLLDTE